MAQIRKHIDELHADYTAWAQELGTARDEIDTLTKRLEEVSSKNTSVEVKANIEHFQNVFVRQNEVVDEMLHKIKLADNTLANTVRDNPTASDHRLFDDDAGMRDEMEQFGRIYAQEKGDFIEFLTKWM